MIYVVNYGTPLSEVQLDTLNSLVALGTTPAGSAVTKDGSGNFVNTVITGSGITLETDGVANGDQALLNLIGGTNVTLTDDGFGGITIDATGGGGGTPGGSTTQLQYNNAGAFGGISGATTNGTVVTLTSPVFATSANGSYLTASEILITDGSKNIVSAPVATYPSLTELTYLKGVTSSIQTQLGAKVGALGAIGSTPNANGATLTGSTLNLEPADATFGGVVSAGTQTFAGAKTFASSATFNAGLTIIGAGAFSSVSSGMQLVGSTTLVYTSGVSVGTTATLTTGVSSARFVVGTGTVGTFTSGTHPIVASTAFKPQTITNNGATVTNTATTYIESAMTGGTNNYALWVDAGTVRIDDTIELGDASDTTISRSSAGVIAVEGVAIPKGTGTANEIAYWSGTNVVGSLAVATYPSLTELSYVKGVTSAIQTQLNGKQASGNYITALTGDMTASGPGSVTATLATVNSNVGSFTNANITVNAKGLITAASNGTPGGSVAFTDLTDVPSSYSGQTGKAVRVNATETGLEFFAASGSGTVTSVDMSVPTGLVVSGNPVTTTGTLAVDLDTGYVIPLQSTIDAKASKSFAIAMAIAL